jgi:MinD-like ATPase involved in chromosome partitioning or flagellar assembly/predicted acylesterase/phospholipase RssA
MTENKPPGKIITFYSYKGGTGRSMALANVAWILASGGKSVLVIDWDLEAPGLHRYFYPFLEDKTLAASDGMINFVNDYVVKAMTPPAEGESLDKDWYVPHANILRYAISLDWKFPSGGSLDFVPAGRQDETYSKLVNSFDWQNFYNRLGGRQFLKTARELMRGEYDYILIDSRTGVSDTSGISTIEMPDSLVVCFTLNNQSIEGAASVADFVSKQRAELDKKEGRPTDFRIFPIPMRIDYGEQDKLGIRSRHAKKRFINFPNYLESAPTTFDSIDPPTADDDEVLNKMPAAWKQYWNNIPIQYVTYYAYEEILAAFGKGVESIGSLLASMIRLSSYLTDGTVSKLEPIPEKLRDRVLAEYEKNEPVKIDAAEESNELAEYAFARLTAEQQKVARRIILRMVKVEGTGETKRNIPQPVSLGDFSPSAQQAAQALANSRLLVIGQNGTGDGNTAQIADETIVRGWKRLQGWLSEEQDFLLWLQGLQERLDVWRRNRLSAKMLSTQSKPVSDESLLLDGDELQSAKEWLQKRWGDLTETELEYIQFSIASREGPASRKEPPLLHSYTKERGAARTGFTERSESQNVAQAKNILRGQNAAPQQLLTLAKGLKAESEFAYARRILSRARRDSSVNKDPKLRLLLTQQHALCTYKDQELPADLRHKRALEILIEEEDLRTTIDQETLGLVGAIYKRMWEADNQKVVLERSLAYYHRGYKQGIVGDYGYTGINAAFILDLLAHQEEAEAREAATTSESAAARRREARRIREDIVDNLPPLMAQPGNEWLEQQWWFLVTVAEANFGLGRYMAALPWLQKAKSIDVKDWEYESTARQLASLARLHETRTESVSQFENSPAGFVLSRFLEDTTAVRSAFIGKVGLALSGGGFRASLYQIGTLAKLAELDVLRRVEVLSCVSGGSIIGAHYYLEVRRLLQTKPDHEITREDYIEIVQRIEKRFLEGVQRNIRVSAAAEFLTNVKMIFLSGYSRTQRVGELYEEEIFSRVDDGEGNARRWMNELLIRPLDEGSNFSPKYHNWKREAKVPVLILNATTLNTGHNWQFTASWMGEPPAAINSDVDGNEQYRRMYYQEAPEKYRQVRLGHAVAASSCVPGLFEPLVFEDLYPDRIVRLVDGGVQDNQGVSGLLEQGCTVILASDASGQMESRPAPSNKVLGVLLRSSDIVQARLREAQYKELDARRRSSLLRGLMFTHLKSDLNADPVDWIGCEDPYEASDEARPIERRGVLTTYGIRKDVQQRLAAIRTDLDSFNDAEAYALMTSGYRMAEEEFAKCIKDFPVSSGAQPQWGFLTIEEPMKGGSGHPKLLKLLDVGGHLAFKVWMLSPRLKALVRGAVVVLLLLISWFVVSNWSRPIFEGVGRNIADYLKGLTVGAIVLAMLMTAVTLLANILARSYVYQTLVKAVRYKKTLHDIAVGLGMSCFGFLLARLHLLIFDPLYLKLGKVERVLGYNKPPARTEQTSVSS